MPELETYRLPRLSSAVPIAETRPPLTTVDGVLELVNGGVKIFTLEPTVPTNACPAALNTICPLFVAEPLLKVTEGVLLADCGALKNCRCPALSPTRASLFASKPIETTLFDTKENAGVEPDDIGSVYAWTVPGVLSLPTYRC